MKISRICALAFVFLATSLLGQVSVAPYITSQPQFLDNNANPLAAGCVFTYAAGTATPLATYTDSSGSVQNANPIILNSGGFPASGIWLGSSAYKFVVKSFGGSSCASGSTIRTEDNINQNNIINVVRTNPAATQTIAGDFQLNGAGSLNYKRIESVRYADQFSDTPPTLTNTYADCGSAQCRVFIPSTMASGQPTSSGSQDNIVIEDIRGTSIPIGNVSPYKVGILFEQWGTSANATSRPWPVGQQVHATGGGDGVANHAEMVADFTGAERTGGSRPIWAFNSVVQYTNLLNNATSDETDVNNNSGTDVGVGNELNFSGFKAVSGGTNRPGAAFDITSSTVSNGWQYGVFIANINRIFIKMTEPVGFSGQGIYYIPAAANTNLAYVLRNATDTGNQLTISDNGNFLTTGVVTATLFNTNTANQAGSGQYRMASSDTACWRNNANSADICVSKNASDQIVLPTVAATTFISPTITTGVANSGTGLKHIRSATTCSTAAGAGSSCTTAAISWSGSAFADTNYDMTCNLFGVSNTPTITQLTKSAGSFTVTITAVAAGAATYTEVDCIAIHD